MSTRTRTLTQLVADALDAQEVPRLQAMCAHRTGFKEMSSTGRSPQGSARRAAQSVLAELQRRGLIKFYRSEAWQKISVNLEDDLDPVETPTKLREMTEPLPSVSKAKSGALRDAPRVQLAFSNVPKPIKEAFDSEAARRGIGKKELLYFCLRLGGIPIPEQDEIDGRRR